MMAHAPVMQVQRHNLTTLASFNGANGAMPTASLLNLDGFLYGTTSAGGANNLGAVFSYRPATGAFTILASFNGKNGEVPNGLINVNGLLYGTTYSGGLNNDGCVFSFNPATGQLTDVADFDGKNGQDPQGWLTDVNGLLYGTTRFGGAPFGGRGMGNVFSFNPQTGQTTDIADFHYADGENPAGGMALAENGWLYGTTEGGGKHGAGTVFAINPQAGKLFSNVADFDGASGAQPEGGLRGVGRMLYGVTVRGGAHGDGTVFSFSSATYQIADIADFSSAPHAGVNGGLADVNGVLYGTTSDGGASGMGKVFSLDLADGALADIADFGGKNGAAPCAGLVNVNGTLYGTTAGGGAHHVGTVFALTPRPAPPGATLADVAGFVDIHGDNPEGGLVDVNGIFYGTCAGDVGNSCGTVFSYNPRNGVLSDLADFSYQDSHQPQCRLTLVDGLLYGTTAEGGSNPIGPGTVFVFNPVTHALADVAHFNGENGDSPESALLNVNGILYGTTRSGGTTNSGVVFSFNPKTHALAALASFTVENGIWPQGDLLDVNGILYGTASEGGAYYNGGRSSFGVVFAFNLKTHALTALASFNGRNGVYPDCGLTFMNSLLYGTTALGGAHNNGAVFWSTPGPANSPTLPTSTTATAQDPPATCWTCAEPFMELRSAAAYLKAWVGASARCSRSILKPAS